MTYWHKNIFVGLFFLKRKSTAIEALTMALLFKKVFCVPNATLYFSPSPCFKLIDPNNKHSIIVTRVAFIQPRNYEKVNAFNMTSSKENILNTFYKLLTFSLFFLLLAHFPLWESKHKAIMKREKFAGPYLYLPTVWAKRTASLGRNGELFPSRLRGNHFHILDLCNVPD